MKNNLNKTTLRLEGWIDGEKIWSDNPHLAGSWDHAAFISAFPHVIVYKCLHCGRHHDNYIECPSCQTRNSWNTDEEENQNG